MLYDSECTYRGNIMLQCITRMYTYIKATCILILGLSTALILDADLCECYNYQTSEALKNSAVLCMGHNKNGAGVVIDHLAI